MEREFHLGKLQGLRNKFDIKNNLTVFVHENMKNDE